MSICLTSEELRKITGKVKPSAQIRYLRKLGITFIIRADGKPVVSRNHFEAVMDWYSHSKKVPEAEPDFSMFQ